MIRKYKYNNGITLVALIITIIILLILAGITIQQLAKSGPFEKTQLAKQKSENAEKLENERLEKYTNEISKYISGTRNNLKQVTLYPNETGELKNEPQTITLNKRIEIDSPFEGNHTLYVIAEIYNDGMWGETGWFFTTASYGLKALKIERDGVDKIVIQSGTDNLTSFGSYQGNGFGDITPLNTAPFRLKVICLD